MQPARQVQILGAIWRKLRKVWVTSRPSRATLQDARTAVPLALTAVLAIRSSAFRWLLVRELPQVPADAAVVFLISRRDVINRIALALRWVRVIASWHKETNVVSWDEANNRGVKIV